MRNVRILASLVAVTFACLLSACETPTKAYVKQHPELTPEHRKIILAGRIKFGDPVAGMTREQVRLVMGTDPDQFDSINGEDVWIWFKAKTARLDSDNEGEGSKKGKRHAVEDPEETNITETRTGRLKVFFKGNLVTHAEFGGGTL